MAFSSDLIRAERLVKIVGFPETMMLAGWYGGHVVRVPNTTRDQNHIIRKIIGDEGFTALVQAHGGELLSIPVCDVTPLRRAGLVHRLTSRGVSPPDIANIAGICQKTVQTLRGVLRREGYPDLADLLPTDEVIQ